MSPRYMYLQNTTSVETQFNVVNECVFPCHTAIMSLQLNFRLGSIHFEATSDCQP